MKSTKHLGQTDCHWPSPVQSGNIDCPCLMTAIFCHYDGAGKLLTLQPALAFVTFAGL